MYDIVIIGLGPAGSTLARLLNKKVKILAIDKKRANISKCCGGLLAPDAQRSLAKFDICLPKDVLVDPQIFSVRTIDMDNNIEKFYQRFYINLDRKKFDQFLISLIPDNVEVVNGICSNIVKEEDYYVVSYMSNRKMITKKAKIVIGADGANSIVRKKFYSNKKIKEYVAIQEWYPDKNVNAFYSCIFDSKITDSYSWTVSKDKHLIVGGAFPKEDCQKRFALLKKKLLDKGIKLGKPIKKEGCFVYIYKGFSNICTGKNGAYLIGEAAGMISPSSLEGISYAMESASHFANIVNKDRSNIAGRYYRKTLNIRIKLLLKILKKPFMYNKFLRSIVMKSGITSIGKNY